MLSFSIADIVEATGAKPSATDLTRFRLITSVQTDSRNVGQDSLFVCIPGERVDGNDYAESAIVSGAACILMTREPDADILKTAHAHDCAVLRAENDDAIEFMLRLAYAWRSSNPQWLVIGVTGSVGKTTTKDMLAAGLSARYRVHATSGNFNNLLGLPLTVLSASPNDEVLVCEMGMNHKGEIARLSEVARPHIAVITNVGTSHIGYLGSREGIARAKAEIVGSMPPSNQAQSTCLGEVFSCLIMTSDNDFAGFIEQSFCKPAGIEVARVGSTSSYATLTDTYLDEMGHPSFNLAFASGWHKKLTLELTGAAPAIDAALALCVAERIGTDLDQVACAIEAMPATHMRLELVGGGTKPRIIDDSYNASPSSMASALNLLASITCKGRRIAVIGEMGELGDDAAHLHALVGAYAAAIAPDLIIWVGTAAAAQMRDAALVMGFSDDRMELLSDADSALSTIGPLLTPDDLVMVKASRSAGLDRFVRGVLA